MQESNFKNLELYALDHGITALIIHDYFEINIDTKMLLPPLCKIDI